MHSDCDSATHGLLELHLEKASNHAGRLVAFSIQDLPPVSAKVRLRYPFFAGALASVTTATKFSSPCPSNPLEE